MNGYRIETIISKRNESEIMEPKVFDPSLMENRFRHEFKYICSYGQLRNLQCRLSGLIPLDPHAGADGIYNIRSLYFDDYYDRCFMETKRELTQEKNSESASTITVQNGFHWN